MWYTITTDYVPNPGGLARYAFRTAKRYGTPVIQPTWPRIPGGWLWVLKTILSTRADGWIVHQVLPIGTVCWLASWIKRTPYIVVFHGMDAALAFRNPWKAWLTRRILQRAKAVVANTYALAKELREKAEVEPITVHPMASIVGSAQVRRVWKEGEPIVLLSVARLVERKGMQRVLAVLAKHPEWSSYVRYRMVGEGAYADELRHLISAHHLSGWVELIDRVNDDVLHNAYATADVFVLPTITRPHDREGFGIVYLEAASFGLPSIASRIPGVDEAVTDGVTGVLVEDDNGLERAIERAVTDPAWRERMGSAAAKRVSDMTEDEVYTPLDCVMDASSPNGANPHSLSSHAVSRGSRSVRRASADLLPTVSVIIPLYNHARTVEACVRAVLAQESVQVDICIVDDGSTDGGGEVADKLAREHACVQVIHQANAGAPVARNAGIARAQGEFILCLDADAVLRPGILQRWTQALTRYPKAGYVYSDFTFGGKRFRARAFSLKRLRERNFIHTSVLVRATSGLHFDPTLKRFQDWDAWLTLAEKGIEGVYEPGVGMDVAVDRAGYSFWLPRIAYKAPFRYLPGIGKRVCAYEAARKVIAQKHAL